jgi:hypothetical protein
MDPEEVIAKCREQIRLDRWVGDDLRPATQQPRLATTTGNRPLSRRCPHHTYHSSQQRGGGDGADGDRHHGQGEERCRSDGAMYVHAPDQTRPHQTRPDQTRPRLNTFQSAVKLLLNSYQSTIMQPLVLSSVSFQPQPRTLTRTLTCPHKLVTTLVLALVLVLTFILTFVLGTVVGDIHGQYYDLLHMFELNGLPGRDKTYVVHV